MRTMPKAPEGPYTTINGQPIYNSNNNVIEPKVVNDFTLLTPLSSSEVRTNFISKVYTILWIQLMTTSIFIGCCNQLEPVKQFMLSPVGYSLMFPAVILLLIMTCIGKQLLTIKCPSNMYSESDLLRVTSHISKFIKFDFNKIDRYEFEHGKQNQVHIHAIINKLRVLPDNELKTIAGKFKGRPCIYDEVVPDFGGKIALLEHKIDTKHFIWHLRPISNTEHLENLKEYIVKEQVHFIDE